MIMVKNKDKYVIYDDVGRVIIISRSRDTAIKYAKGK